MTRKVSNTVESGIRRGLDYLFSILDRDEDRINAIQRWIISLLEGEHPHWFAEKNEQNTSQDLTEKKEELD